MTILTPEETAAEEIRAPPSSFCLLWSQTKTVKKKNPRRLTLLTTRIGFPPVFTPFIAASLGIASSWALRFPSVAYLRHLFLPQASVLSCFFFFLPKNKNMCCIHLVPWIAGKANFLRSYYVPWADPIPLSFYTASGGAGALTNSEINRLRSGKLKALEGEFANLL